MSSHSKDEAQTALFEDPVSIALYTLFISVIKTNHFTLKVAQVAVCSQINTKHKYSVGRTYSFYPFITFTFDFNCHTVGRTLYPFISCSLFSLALSIGQNLIYRDDSGLDK